MFFSLFFRCSKWLVNIRRADLNLKNIKSKQVCSVHFEQNAYNCPSDTLNCKLLPTAIPTIVQCPNPPKPITTKRPPPKKRHVCNNDTIQTDFTPPPKKRRVDNGNMANYTEELPSSNHDDEVRDKTEELEMLKKQVEQHKLAIYSKTVQLDQKS